MAVVAPAPPRPAPPVIAPDLTLGGLAARISDLVLTRPVSRGWLLGLGLSLLLLGLLGVAVAVLLVRGVGIWGVNVPVAWGFAITNFVWWIGIGHAGTLISAILLLLHQGWRESINRLAEAMTLFAVLCAGLFPLLHLGRPWFFYWLVPYPTTFGVQPQYRSPLVWDVFAVFTYFVVSLVFWYVGMLPDLATLRDRARSRRAQVAYGVLALGWRGSAAHWRRWRMAYLLMAGLATPLVVSVHSTVAFDFAYALVPGWHTTLFPPYFVAGAIFSGFAMVLTLAIPLRALWRLHDLITERHLDACAQLTLATGLIVGYGYLMEAFSAWYSGSVHEMSTFLDRLAGPYGWAFWTLVACNVAVIQPLWWRAVRRSPVALFAIAILVNVGMWLERFVIVVQSLSHDWLPSSWHLFRPTFWDWATLAGSFGLFFTCWLLFLRLLPAISIAETGKLLSETRARERGP